MTKNQIKLFQALSRQKYRKEYNSYLVEGDKNAKEWLSSDCTVRYIAANAAWLATNRQLVERHPEAGVLAAESFELEKITTLQHAPEVTLIVEKPVIANLVPPAPGIWTLFLDRIQDPGNMGTIIRTADWFGIRHLICSPGSVEVYNPKVVQASMGSLLRVQVYELSAEELLLQHPGPLYAACLSGKALKDYGHDARPGIIAMGNESQGLSDLILSKAGHKITIPRTGQAESLNVAVATGIICYHLAGQE